MSSYSSEELPVFNTVEEERDYWKKRCLIAEKNDQQLIKCHDYEEKEDCVAIPRKRARIEDAVPTDPIKLPEPCFQAIMKYLNGNEILECMEVNKTWKKCIESCKLLMDRAMREICVKFTIEDYTPALISDDIKRNYKQMKAQIIVQNIIWPSNVIRIPVRILTNIINPFERYASTLETLTITHVVIIKFDFNEITEKGELNPENERNLCTRLCVFLKLTNLMIEKPIKLSYLKNFSFPVLTSLKLKIDQDLNSDDDFVNNDEDYDLKEFLLKCPNLKFLRLKYESDEREFQETDPNEFPLELDPNQPEIQSIHISYYAARFLRHQKNSLVRLNLDNLFTNEISWLLRDLKMLKTLTIFQLNLLNEENGYELFLENDSIEKFTLVFVKNSSGFYVNLDELNLLHIERLLRSLPSLVDLSLYNDDKTGEVMNFVASNMVNLKIFSCDYSRESSQLAYQHIKDNPNEYINSTFEYVIRRPEY